MAPQREHWRRAGEELCRAEEVREQKAARRRARAARRMLAEDLCRAGLEEEDSEYEPEDKYCDCCGLMSQRYVDEDMTEEDYVTFDPNTDVCACGEECEEECERGACV